MIDEEFDGIDRDVEAELRHYDELARWIEENA